MSATLHSKIQSGVLYDTRQSRGTLAWYPVVDAVEVGPGMHQRLHHLEVVPTSRPTWWIAVLYGTCQLRPAPVQAPFGGGPHQLPNVVQSCPVRHMSGSATCAWYQIVLGVDVSPSLHQRKHHLEAAPFGCLV